MSDPTLKIRVQTGSGNWGRNCIAVAKEIIEQANGAGVQGGKLFVLDAKWGREPDMWAETGRGWGRPTLTPVQRGYIDAVRDSEPAGQVRRLLDIIDELVKR